MSDEELVLAAALLALAQEKAVQQPVYRPPLSGGGVVAAVAPLFSSAEIGTVNTTTIAVTFDQNISASNYATGVTIKKGGSTQTISSATRQVNHAIVYYVLSAAALSTDALTWQYTGGNIVAEDDNIPLGTVSAQNVTNNITIGDDLKVSAVAYWKMDEASGTRVDATGNSKNISDISGATNATGKIGNGLSISNPAHYARYNGVSFSFANTNYSIALWLKVRAFGVGQANCVFTYYNSGDSSVEYGLETDDFGFPGMAFYTQFGFVDSSALGGLSTDTWYFVVVEQDADLSKVRLRINELAVQETGFGSPNVGVGNRLSFGSDETLQGLDCITDEVLVINRLLTANERAYLYNSGAGRTLYP